MLPNQVDYQKRKFTEGLYLKKQGGKLLRNTHNVNLWLPYIHKDIDNFSHSIKHVLFR